MSILGNLESRIASLVEGTFGRAFRAEIRPVELARRLAKEMDAHRTTSLQRTYVPNEYVVWLSRRDRERYRGVEDSVIEELSAYLLEHARDEHLSMVAQPLIEFHTDESLSLGECAIEARTDAGAGPAPVERQPASRPLQEPFEPAAGGSNTMIFSRAERLSAPLENARTVRQSQAIVVLDGKRVSLSLRGALLGRSRECDIVIAAGEVSRRHAQITTDGAGGWLLADLGSTNGVRLNGRPVVQAEPLTDGDLIELGSVPLRFEVAR